MPLVCAIHSATVEIRPNRTPYFSRRAHPSPQLTTPTSVGASVDHGRCRTAAVALAGVDAALCPPGAEHGWKNISVVALRLIADVVRNDGDLGAEEIDRTRASLERGAPTCHAQGRLVRQFHLRARHSATASAHGGRRRQPQQREVIVHRRGIVARMGVNLRNLDALSPRPVLQELPAMISTRVGSLTRTMLFCTQWAAVRIQSGPR